MSEIYINNNTNTPIARMEGIKEAAQLFGLPKNLVRVGVPTGRFVSHFQCKLYIRLDRKINSRSFITNLFKVNRENVLRGHSAVKL